MDARRAARVTIQIEEPVRTRVPGRKALVWAFGHGASFQTNISFTLSTLPHREVLWGILSSEEYEKFPKGTPTKAWRTPLLQDSVVLRGTGPWYFIVSNPHSDELLIQGTVAHSQV